MKELTMVVVAGAAFILHADTGVWTNADAGATPAAAARYADAENWHGGLVPVAAGDTAYFTNVYAATRYVELPSSLTLGAIYSAMSTGSSPTILIGGTLNLDSGTSADARLNFKGRDGVVHRIYANVSSANGLSTTHTEICGDITCGGGAAVCTFSGGHNRWRLEKYANSADPVRTNPLKASSFVHGNSTVIFSAPGSAEAKSGVWECTEGSPYLHYVSGAKGSTLSVGCWVSGEGVPSGAFVKRIFDDNWIEISGEAEASGSVDISFAAFSPSVVQYIQKWECAASSSLFYLGKGSADAEFRVEAGKLTGNSKTYRYTISCEPGKKPGVFVIGDATAFYDKLCADVCELEFAPNASGKVGLPSTGALYMSGASSSVGLTVTGDVSAVVSVVSNVVGTLAKRGSGKLEAALAPDGNTGDVVVEAGVLSFFPAGGADAAALSKLSVSAGATFAVPSGTISVAALTLEDGAILAGPGTIEVPGSAPDLSKVRLTGGIQLKVAGVVDAMTLDVPDATAPAGNPAFWLDASRSAEDMVLETSGTSTLVKRWNDCRGEGYLFATNIVKAPQLVTTGAKPYVKFVHRNVEKHYYVDEDGLVWSDVLPNVRAVFLVADPVDGGGYILGRSTRIPDSAVGEGGAFQRENDGWAKKLAGGSCENVLNGRFFIDGDKIDHHTQGYRGPGIQLVECHTAGDVPADAFSLGVKEGNSHYAAHGNMRVCEYVIYTNELTHAERAQTAQYLMKKWTGRDAEIAPVDERADIGTVGTASGEGGLDVADGESLTATPTGGGTLLKTGGGSLYIPVVTNGSLHAADGLVVVNSMPLDASVVPADDCWIHLDAADDKTLETEFVDGTNFVKKWSDKNGNGMSAQKTARDTANAANGWIRENAMNNLPMVDLGERVYATGTWASPSPNRMLEFRKPNGSAYKSGNSYATAATGAPLLQSIFIVYATGEYSGNAVLAARGASYDSYGFNPAASGAEPSVLVNYDNFNGLRLTLIDQIAKNTKSAFVRLDGEGFNPRYRELGPGMEDVFTYSVLDSALGRRTCGMACYGYDRYVGGMMYGEVILCSNYVGGVKTKQIEAYLMKKWKGVDTPGYAAAVLDSLAVDEGATVKVLGTAPLTVSTLVAAGGTVEGAVRLAEGATLSVPIVGNSLGAVSLAGGFDFSGGCAVSVVGNADSVAPGVYTIVSSPSVKAESAALWTFVEPDAKRRVFSLSVVDGSVVVGVSKRGLSMIVR